MQTLYKECGVGGHGLNSVCRCSITCSKTVGAVRVVCFCKDGETIRNRLTYCCHY